MGGVDSESEAFFLHVATPSPYRLRVTAALGNRRCLRWRTSAPNHNGVRDAEISETFKSPYGALFIIK
jgi:hypothetical protein